MGVDLQLPGKNEITCVDPRAEPTRYYYWPVVGWFYRRRLQDVLDLLGSRRYHRLLEVAYGSGLFLPSLAQLCDQLHGIDMHQHTDIAGENLAKSSLKAGLVCGDALGMPYENEVFDCVVSVSMLEHLTEPGVAVDEMLRVTKPGGVLALGFPCRNPWLNAFFRLLGYDPTEIHPSSHRDILRALDDRRLVYRGTHFPRWATADTALYHYCMVTKAERT